MRSLHVARCLSLAALLGACSGGEAIDPIPGAGSLSLRVDGDPAKLRGVVVVEAVASPPEAFDSVALRIGGAPAGVTRTAPFTFTIDTSAFPDGRTFLDVEATPALPRGPVRASLDVALANRPPGLVITSPLEGATLVGSPSKGFTVRPVVAAADGNGIEAIWAEAGGAPVDLGSGDGTVEVPLSNLGVDFPHPAVPITIHARDRSGAETTAVIEVVPSNVKVRFEQPTGFKMGLLNRVDVVDDGRPLIQIGSSLSLLPEPAIPAKPSLSLAAVDKFVRRGSDLFYFSGKNLIRASLDGDKQTLLDLASETQHVPAGGPFLHSSGRFVAAWQDQVTTESHLVAFEPDGTPAFDTKLTGLLKLYEVAEAPDGRVLGEVLLADGPSYIQPFAGDTGAALPAFAPGGGQIVLADDHGVVYAYATQTTYGAPEAHFSEIGFATGEVLWDELVGSAYPQLLRRLPGGQVLAFLQGVPSTLQVLGPGGAQTLWSGDLDKQEVLVGTIPGTGDMIVSRYNGVTDAISAFRLRPDGTIAWTAQLPGGPGFRARLLSDGALAFASSPLSLAPPSASFTVVGTDGQIQWTTSMDALMILGAVEHEDLLILPSSLGDGKPFSYEARRRATGDLLWRYREGVSPPLFQIQTLATSPQWGVVFAPLILSKSDPVSGQSYTSVVLGLVP